MRTKELPIYWDLIRLPLVVFLKRLYKRFVKSKEKPLPSLAADSWSLNSILYQPKGLACKAEERKKLETLINYYSNYEFNYLGSDWTSILNKNKPRGFQDFSYGNFPRKALSENLPDWNRDQRTGFQFDQYGKPSIELSKAFNKAGVDVKFCWEFARLHHLPQLGIANRLKADPQHQKIFTDHVQSFNQQCPYNKGIHWSSAMEVSIRLVNILVGYDLLFDNSQPKQWLLKMLFEHWWFVKENLEHKEGLGTNHYLSNLMALVVSGDYLSGPQVKEQQYWALGEFEKELQKQFFNDGGNFEYSVYYHRLSTEIALITYAYGVRSGYKFREKTEKKLSKAVAFVEALLKDDASLPNFGDNDSGRVLDLLSQGSMNENNFEPAPGQSSFILEIYQGLSGASNTVYQWFFNQVSEGKANISKHEPIPYTGKASTFSVSSLAYTSTWVLSYPVIDLRKIKLYAFEETGLYIFKSEGFYLAVNLMANPKGHRYRGHMHNDKGSFELRVRGEDLINDAGVLSYTATTELRNHYRDTQAHPVAFVGIEQNRYLNNNLGLFHLKLDVEVKVLEIGPQYLFCYISYRDVKNYRRFDIEEDKLIVRDWCNKPFEVTQKYWVPIAEAYGRLR